MSTYIQNSTILVRLRCLKKELETASGFEWEEHSVTRDVVTGEIAGYHLRAFVEDITIYLYGGESYQGGEPTGNWSWSPYLQRPDYCNTSPGHSAQTPAEAWSSCQDTIEQWLFRPDEISLS